MKGEKRSHKKCIKSSWNKSMSYLDDEGKKYIVREGDRMEVNRLINVF